MLSDYRIEGMEVDKYIWEPIKSNMYIMVKDDTALVIDPHISREAVEQLRQANVEKVWIILTHEHFDHISGVNHFRENWDCTVICGKQAKNSLPDPHKNLAAYFMAMMIGKEENVIQAAKQTVDEQYGCYADVGFEEEYDWEWNGLMVHLVETPGHSKGSICVLVNGKYLFSGDSLVGGNRIITKLPGGSKKEYQAVTKPFLEQLSADVIVFPGHGEEGKISDFDIV